MKSSRIHIAIIFLFSGFVWSQDDAVVSFSLPVRNSLTFNRFALNPTFSFVREQNKTISFTNKREWVQFEDAPNSFLFSYSGRLNEKSGFGAALFQQNYGVFTNYGGVLNYAYNVPFSYESNLTFGANLAFYQSGINTGNVVTNFPDPSLSNVPSNFLMTINPSINYGTRFFDFGLTLNNFTLYNFTSSSLVEDDPERSIQPHIMYTGFMQSPGFFNDSKFSALLRSEFRDSDVVVSGLMMLTVPKGIWGQAGYSTLNGFSVGFGVNILKGIALEYNYEKRLGNLVDFGSAHEITLAYRFKNNSRQRYDDEMEMASIIPEKRRTRVNNTDDATRARIAARAEARRLEQQNASTTESIDKPQEVTTKNDAVAKAKQKEKEAAKIKSDQLANERAEAEALAKLKALKAAEEEAKRLAILKADEDKRRKEALQALALAEAEEKKLQQQANEKAEARRIAEEQARIKAAKQAEEEAKRLATLKAEEEKRRQEALAALAAAEAEEKKQIEEAKRQEERRLAEEAAQLKAQKQAEAEAKRLAELKANEEVRRQKALAALAAAEAEENKKNAIVANDKHSKSIQNLTKESNKTREEQEALIRDLSITVDSRKQDLADLKEENDLSEKGIYKAPKPFKSISEQNAKLTALTNSLDKTISDQDKRIEELERLIEKRKKEFPSDDDEMNMIYLDEIVILQKSQKKTKEAKKALLLELSRIKMATEIERKRRIKRAAYDNQEDRYAKDMADLKKIKETTTVDISNTESVVFDFGESNSGTIKILKDVKYTENGYYLVVAVHADKAKRDEFLRSVISTGVKEINFFYDFNTSKYYIYSKKFNNLNEANNAMAKSGELGYDQNMSMIKIENKSMK